MAPKNRRWMKSMIAASKSSEVDLPWARGAKARAFKAGAAARLCAPKLAARA